MGYVLKCQTPAFTITLLQYRRNPGGCLSAVGKALMRTRLKSRRPCPPPRNLNRVIFPVMWRPYPLPMSFVAIGVLLLCSTAARAQDMKTLEDQALRLHEAGKNAEALPLSEKAAQLHRQADGPASEPYADSFEFHAFLLRLLGRNAEAAKEFTEIVAIRRKLPDHHALASSLNRLAVAAANCGESKAAYDALQDAVPIYREEGENGKKDLAQALGNYGFVAHAVHEDTNSEKAFRESLSLYEALRTDPSAYVDTIANLGVLLADTGRAADAAPLIEKALTIERGSRPPSDPSLGIGLRNLTSVYKTLRRYQDGLGTAKQALDYYSSYGLPQEQLTAASALADIQVLSGDRQSASATMAAALEIGRKKIPKGDSALTDAINSAGVILADGGNAKEAEPLYREALSSLQAEAIASPAREANIKLNLALALHSLGKYEEELSLCRRVVELRKGLVPFDAKQFNTARVDLAGALRSNGMQEEARAILVDSLADFRKGPAVTPGELAWVLGELGISMEELGHFKEAEAAFTEAYDLRKKDPSDTVQLALAAHNLGDLYRRINKMAQAEELLKQASQLYASRPVNQATTIGTLGMLYENEGRYKDAEAELKESLRLDLANLPPDHPDVVRSRNNLGTFYTRMGRFAEAREQLTQCLEINRSTFHGDHPRVAFALNNLGLVDEAIDRNEEALAEYSEAIAMQRRILSANSPDIAITLNNLGLIKVKLSRLSDAEKDLQDAIDIRKRTFGGDHPDVAQALNNLSTVYEHEGRYEEAEKVLREALTKYQKSEGENHPDAAMAMNNLANVLREMGRFPEAESLERKSAALHHAAQPDGSDGEAKALENLSLLLMQTGRYQEGLTSAEAASAILERLYASRSLELATVEGDISAALTSLGRWNEAADHARKALATTKEILPADHADVATRESNLAAALIAIGKLDEADKLLQDAQSIKEKRKENIATTLDNRGFLAMQRGDLASAEDLFNKSLAQMSTRPGDNSADVALAKSNLAWLRAKQGRWSEASDFAAQSLEGSVQVLENFRFASSESAVAAFANPVRMYLSLYLSIAAHVHDDRLTAQAMHWVLRTKAIAYDANIRLNAARRLVEGDTDFRRLADSAARLKEESLRGTGTISPEATAAEADLNRALIAKFPNIAPRAFSVEDVQRSLPEKAALIEFLKYTPLDLLAKDLTDPNQLGSERYLAFVLPGKQGSIPRSVDIGECKDIDDCVSQLRASFAKGGRALVAGALPGATVAADFLKASQSAYKRIVVPLKDLLADSTSLVIAPDGDLSQIPFECFVDDSGKYLLETYEMSYVGCGRDCMGTASKEAASGPVTVVAAPDYNYTSATATSAGTAHSLFTWSPLPGAEEEGRLVASTLKSAYGDVRQLFGKGATEANMLTVRQPAILHIATHGFFFPAPSGSRSSSRSFMSPGGFRFSESPLLRTGLALAGANQATGEGWFTSAKAGELDLRGTELVVLSACETGLGDVEEGEGISGLPHAFFSAGARTLISSLFDVPDAATKELMSRFYAELVRSKGKKLESLRTAQRALMKPPQNGPPVEWASFVLLGQR